MYLRTGFFSVLTCLMMATIYTASGVDTSGLIFLGGEYVLQSEDNEGYNAFDVSRIYLTIKDSLPQRENSRFQTGYRATVDLKRFENGYLVRALKFGYIELVHISTGVKVQLGQHLLPWVAYADRILGIRFVTLSFPNRLKKLDSTDLGLSVMRDLPRGYGDIHISVVNGEGYHAAEVNKYKDFMGRLSIRPLPNNANLKGLMANVYFGYGVPEKDMSRHRLVGALTYQGKCLAMIGEYLGSWDGDSDDPINGAGFASSMRFDLGKLVGADSYGVLGKMERFDPNIDQEDDSQFRILVGIYYEVVSGLKFALDYEALSHEGNGDTEGTIALHTQTKF